MALTQTFQDNFDDGIRDPTLWVAYGTTSEASGRLILSSGTTAAYSGYFSKQAYVGTSSYSHVEVVSVGNQSLTSFEVFPMEWQVDGSSDNVQYLISGGVLKARKTISAVITTLASGVFNSDTHRWLRIRESSGTTFWEYSSDGQAWSTFHSVANPIPVTSVNIEIAAGAYADEGVSSEASFDNFNIASDAATLANLAEEDVRRIAASLQVSWKKDFRSGITVFTIGVSTIGGSDIIGGTVPSISAWNKYLYYDESDYLLSLDWEQQLNIPMGGLSIGLASALLENTSGRFLPEYMGGDSELFTAVLTRRPFIINAGFESAGVGLYEPQFVGELSRNPQVSVTSKTAQLQGEDFITFLKNKRVDDTTMFTGQTSTQIMESILTNSFGLSTAQFNLEQGLNQIPFSMIESGSSFYDYFNSLAQAELGQFFQDENGILRFWNRQHWNTEPNDNPMLVLSTAEVIESDSTDYDHIINVVEVKANPLKKQTTTIFTLQSSIELSPGSNEFFIDFDNPVLAASTPSHTANTQSDGSGSNVTGSVVLTNRYVFSRSAKYTYNNTTGATAYITALTVSGRWAIPQYEGGINRIIQDDSSVTAYDERRITVENDYIQTDTWARGFGQMVLNQYAEPENLQEIVIRAKPTLHVGDIITWRSINWVVFSISNYISKETGYTQKLKLLRKGTETYFTIGISSIGGPDLIAA